MTRVLHIIKTLGLGGAETNLLNLVGALDPKKIENHIAYSHGGENEGRFKRGGPRLFKYAEGQHKIKSFETFAIIARLVRYIRANRIDIVHTHNSNAQVWGCLAAKFAGAKLVEHVHDFRYMEEADYKARRGATAQYRYIRFFTRWSDRVVVLTKGNREYLLKHRLCREERIREIRNGIPLEAPSVPAESFGLGKEEPVILMSVRMAPEKNVDLVLRIAPEVLREVPNAVFLMAGDGPLLDELKKTVLASPIGPRVRFVGFQADVPALLGIAKVFLLPSFLELHSISILEALSQGVPVVVSSGVGCNSETLTDGENAFLLDPFSDEGWAAAVVRLLKDQELSRKIGENGRKLCREQFDIQKTARRFEELYQELIR